MSIDTTDLKKRISESGLPPRSKTDNLLLLTWNIANFGKTKTPEAAVYIAEIMKRFDIIAIQEVKDNLSGLELLQKELGENFRFIFSDVSGNGERLVFCYYKKNVKFTGLSAEVVNNPGLGVEKKKKSNFFLFGKKKQNDTIRFRAGNIKQRYDIHKVFEIFSDDTRIDRIEVESTRSSPIVKGQVYRGSNFELKITEFEKIYHKKGDPRNGYYLTVQYMGDKTADIIIKQKELEFNRTPYVVSFSKNNCNFIVTNVHIFYGDSSSILFRKQELEMLANYLKKHSSDADALDPDYIACGDFNIETAVESEIHQAEGTTSNLETSQILNSLFKALTSKGLIIPQSIRQLGTNLDQSKHYDQIGFHKYSDSTIEFVQGNVINFVGAVFPELDSDPLRSKKTRDKLKSKLSDHLPLWAEFSIKPDQNPIQINQD